jgi:hypothetical protein
MYFQKLNNLYEIFQNSNAPQFSISYWKHWPACKIYAQVMLTNKEFVLQKELIQSTRRIQGKRNHQCFKTLFKKYLRNI